MMRVSLVAWFVLLTTAPVAAQQDGPTKAVSRQEVRLNGRTLFVPEGFRVEVAAGPPLVKRPICVAFDDQGRLYVAESSGSNDPVQEQLKKRPHRILRLEDTDGDGVYDRRTVFADRMMFPEGVLWYRGSVYVAAPPSIWKLTDTDGDGVADERQEWFLGKTLTHCANDLHGPYLGPDGWLYWCKGAFAEQRYPRFSGPPFVTRAAHVFRCPPDAPVDPGTGAVDPRYVDPVMAGGMDNPVEVVFTREGELIFSTTFLVHPGGGLRDGLIHVIYGGVYGKDQLAIEGHPRTGGLMPPLLHLGPAAACGLARYRSTVFGTPFRDNLFVCAFNLHEVFRVTLEARGSSFTATATPFFGSSDIDFHPTDVEEDADGSLLVVDTGGWYKLCCPSSQLWKPDVLGAIYRIRSVGSRRVADPWGHALQWEEAEPAELVERLGDPRPRVRDRAIEELARRGSTVVGALASAVESSSDEAVAVRAVWALARMDGPEARAALRRALDHRSSAVQRAALHVVALVRDSHAREQLVRLLQSSDPFVRRRAAEALGRIKAAEAVPALLRAAARAVDRAEEHAIIYALIQIDAPKPTRAGLSASEAATRKAALIALDQMPHGNLSTAEVLALIDANDPSLHAAALWVLQHHPDWGAACVPYLRNALTEGEDFERGRQVLSALLQALLPDSQVQALVAELVRRKSDAEVARFLLEQLSSARLQRLEEPLTAALAELLDRPLAADDPTLRLVVEVLHRVRPMGHEEELRRLLVRVGKASHLPAELRLRALAAVPGAAVEADDVLFAFLVEHLRPEQAVSTRGLAARVLTKLRLSRRQVETLTELLPELGPLEVEQLLLIYRRWQDEQLAARLLASLRTAPARTALNLQLLQQQRNQYPPAMRRVLAELAALVQQEIRERRARIVELLRSLPPGDVRRGQQVFHSSKAACSACHAIGYLGGRVGPDLTRIGRVRSKLELLEAIVDPSASIIRSYEPVLIMTRDGRIINGLIQRETNGVIELVTGPDQRVQVRRSEVEAMRASNVSIMPAGLDQQLSRQELADLLEFLANCR